MKISDKYNLTSLANAIYDTGVNLAERRLDWLALMYSMAGGGEDLRASFHKLASQGSSYRFKENDREFTKAIKKTSDENLAWLLKKAKELGLNLDDYKTLPNLPHPLYPPNSGGRNPLKGGNFPANRKREESPPFKGGSGRVSITKCLLPSLHSKPKMNFIPNEYLTKCRSNNSTFVQSLVSTRILTAEQAFTAADLYHLGAMKDGSVIYWQIDTEGRIRDGKIMQYGADCHRLKDRGALFLGALMKSQLKGADGKPLLAFDWHSTQCLFGLHLLKEKGEGKNEKLSPSRVMIVEAEKTAVILSQLRPDSLWLASGGEGQLNVDKLAPLLGKKVTLFPDTDPDGKTFQNWQHIANEARRQLGLDITVSDLLEKYATPEQKERKIDIADFVEPTPGPSDVITPLPCGGVGEGSILHEMIEDNPAMAELISQFDLVETANE